MSAFLKIDHCLQCRQEHPWGWVEPVHVRGQLLAGTGVWRSSLSDGLCGTCLRAVELETCERLKFAAQHSLMVRLFGVKPAENYTFESYAVESGNRIAFEQALAFDARKKNLYLWGPTGVGKTHLTVAIARRAIATGASVVAFTPSKLIRSLRMRAPDEEQQVIDRCVNSDVLLLDDFGTGPDSTYFRQALQEILDARISRNRQGLVLASNLSVSVYRHRTGDLANASRLGGACDVVEVQGPDRRAGFRRPTRKC